MISIVPGSRERLKTARKSSRGSLILRSLLDLVTAAEKERIALTKGMEAGWVGNNEPGRFGIRPDSVDVSRDVTPR